MKLVLAAVCGWCSFVLLGCVLLGIFGFTVALRQKYTPLYIPLSCAITNKTLGKPTLTKDGAVQTQVYTEIFCKNSNVYDVHVESSDANEMYMFTRRGADFNMSRIGTVRTYDVVLERHGEATLSTKSDVELSNEQVQEMLLADEVQMLTKMSSSAFVRLNFFVAEVETPWFESSSWCGMSIDAQQYPPKEGRTACYSTEEELELHLHQLSPNVSSPTADIQMGPESVQTFAVLRDVLSCVVVSAALLAFASLLVCACSSSEECRYLVKGRQQQEDLEAAVVVDPEKDSAAPRKHISRHISCISTVARTDTRRSRDLSLGVAARESGRVP